VSETDEQAEAPLDGSGGPAIDRYRRSRDPLQHDAHDEVDLARFPERFESDDEDKRDSVRSVAVQPPRCSGSLLRTESSGLGQVAPRSRYISMPITHLLHSRIVRTARSSEGCAVTRKQKAKPSWHCNSGANAP
jgi:hypothetical protein